MQQLAGGRAVQQHAKQTPGSMSVVAAVAAEMETAVADVRKQRFMAHSMGLGRTVPCMIETAISSEGRGGEPQRS